MKIRVEKTEEDKQIALADCEPGELVRLADGAICLVVKSVGAVIGLYRSEGVAAVWLRNDGAEMCTGLAEDMISGKGPQRIVERLGLLVVEGE
jgi:hypothetical protein